MAAHQSAREGDDGHPADLSQLRRMYLALPPPSIRYDTVPGQDFRRAMLVALLTYRVRVVAEAIGVSTQTVRNIANRREARDPKPWPSQDDIREILAAWRIAEARRSPVTGLDREYAVIHTALIALQEWGFDYRDVASAMRIEPRTLKRFLDPPFSAQKLAQAYAARKRGSRSTRTPRQDR